MYSKTKRVSSKITCQQNVTVDEMSVDKMYLAKKSIVDQVVSTKEVVDVVSCNEIKATSLLT